MSPSCSRGNQISVQRCGWLDGHLDCWLWEDQVDWAVAADEVVWELHCRSELVALG